MSKKKKSVGKKALGTVGAIATGGVVAAGALALTSFSPALIACKVALGTGALIHEACKGEEDKK
ncbi:hypothetical protein [Vibrio fortis]|uniref:hypothetical protein n=1 Tax=Vibrio fortis TaxID=212667 RepID=UPI003EBF6026